MEQKLNFNHNALTIEQLLQSRSNCSIVRAIGQFVHTAQWQVIIILKSTISVHLNVC